MSKDYSVTVKVRNGRILGLMKLAGIESVAELSRRSGVTYQTLIDLIALREAPIRKNGEFSEYVRDLAATLRVEPEEMFTEAQRTMELPTNSVTVDMDEPAVRQIMTGDMERQSWAKIEVTRLLSDLRERERDVVESIASGEPSCEIADRMGISVGRLHQIHAKAINKMKFAASRSDKDCARRFLEMGAA